MSNTVHYSALASLPPCLIKLIIPFVTVPVDRLRLISTTWNAIVLDYIADRSNHPSLDFVQFETGGKLQLKVKVKAHLSLHNKDHFLRLFRGWNTDATFDRVESPFLQLRSFFLGQKVNENRKRLRLIFTRCSSIGNLYLQYNHRKTIDTIGTVLGDVPIRCLHIAAKKLGKDLRKTIARMSHAHNIEKIEITVEREVVKDKLRDLFLNLSDTVKEVVVVENIAEDEGGVLFVDQRRHVYCPSEERDAFS